MVSVGWYSFSVQDSVVRRSNSTSHPVYVIEVPVELLQSVSFRFGFAAELDLDGLAMSTPFTGRPPHRSQRDLLNHWAPASGQTRSRTLQGAVFDEWGGYIGRTASNDGSSHWILAVKGMGP